MLTLHSKEDNSVNFVEVTKDKGAFESRYVCREDDQIIVYLSSHTGCNKSCRFCHLTQTNQTQMVEASVEDLTAQAYRVMDHFDCLDEEEKEKFKKVNFNFMARGEPLANQVVLRKWSQISDSLGDLAKSKNLTPKYNISTIMPTEMASRSLQDVFGKDENVVIYYSLYSLKSPFRRKWLPKAINPIEALNKLSDWQQITGKIPVLHWCFIEDENDDYETMQDIVRAVITRGLKVKFNLVRYNPFSHYQGKESNDETLKRNFEYLANAFGQNGSQIVPRVGYDVKASCGMFVDVTV